LGRGVAQPDFEGVGQRMGWIRGRDEGAVPGVGGGEGGGGGDGGLPDPALARHQDDPHVPAQPVRSWTRCRKPRRAVVTICFSAWRRLKPGILKVGTTLSAYTTSVPPDSASVMADGPTTTPMSGAGSALQDIRWGGS